MSSYPTSFLYGSVIYDASGPAGQLFELYEGLFNRAPDPLGIQGWEAFLAAGASLTTIASGFLTSPEYVAAHGPISSLDDADYVESLYGTVLHRGSDAAGKANWIAALADGTSRGEVALDFAVSTEHLNQTAGVLGQGVFEPGPVASEVARLYSGILGRAAEGSGLQGWVSSIGGGASLTDTAQGFLASPEYTQKYGTPDDRTFVEELYHNALGREAEPSGLQGWLDALSHGASRASVAVGIVESAEAQLHQAASIDPFGLYLAYGGQNGQPGTPPPLADRDGAADSVAEGAATGSATGVTASWGLVSSPNLSFSLSGDTSGGGFQIDPHTGRITVADGSKLDYESSGAAHSYTVTVTAEDAGFSISRTVAVAVTDVNEAPTLTSGGTASVAENAATTAVVYTAQASDPDTTAPNSTLTYSLGGTDAGLFAIDANSGAVRFRASPDYETPADANHDNVYDITVTATDGGNPALSSASRAVAVTVTDQNDNAPVFTRGTSTSATVDEHATAGTTVYSAQATDADGTAANSTVTYTRVGDTSGGGFAVDPNTGQVTVADGSKIDFDASGPSHSYTVTVRASDGIYTVDQSATIAVANTSANAPAFTSGATASEPENTPASTVVYQAHANGVNGDAVTYGLSGSDAGLFTIDATSGEVRFKASPDHEAPADANGDNVYDIVVTALDSAHPADPTSLGVAVTVQNVSGVQARPDVNSYVVGSNLPVTGNVLANDTETDTSNSLTVANPGTYEGTYGTTTINQDGTYTYTPKTLADEADALNQPGPHQDQISYTAIDNEGVQSKSVLTVTSTVVLQARNDTASATEAGGGSNGGQGIDPTGNVLDNDTGAGTTYRVTVQDVAVGNPAVHGSPGTALAGAYGSLTLNSDGSYVYHVANDDPTVDALRPGQSLTDTFTYTITNPDGARASATLTVTVNGADEAPVLTTSNSTLTYTQSQGAVAIDPKVSITDADGNNSTGATVQITGNYAKKGEDVLDVSSFTKSSTDTTIDGVSGYHQLTNAGYENIFVKFDADTGTLILRGTDTHGRYEKPEDPNGPQDEVYVPGHYEDVLRSVTYTNTSSNPSSKPRTVTFKTTDEDNVTSLGATDTIRFVPVAVPDSNTYQSGGAATPPTALLAGFDGVAGSEATSGETHLNHTQIDGIVSAALVIWAEAGLSAAQIAQLKAVTYDVGTTMPGWLGESTPGHVLISGDADGHGWFVDPTPTDNVEFAHATSATHLSADPTSIAAGHMDLLTTVLHEMGEQLGIQDDFAASAGDTLRYGYLSEGERRLPGAGDVVQAIEAQVPDAAKPAAGTPIVLGTAGDDRIDAGHQGAILFGGAGADTFVFHQPEAALPHVAGYSAAKGDVLDVAELTALLHGSDAAVVRVIEDAGGGFATLQVNTHAGDTELRPAWTAVAQLDGVHLGADVSVAIGSGVNAQLAHLHADLLT